MTALVVVDPEVDRPCLVVRPSVVWLLLHLVARPMIARVMSRRLSVPKRQASRFIRETAHSPQKPLRESSSFRPGFTRPGPGEKKKTAPSRPEGEAGTMGERSDVF